MTTANDPDEFDRYIKKVKSGEAGKVNNDTTSGIEIVPEDLRLMRKMVELMTSQELRNRDVAKNIRLITTIYVIGIIGSILYGLLIVISMFS